MKNKNLQTLILHAMVWQAETLQCFSIRHRTPKACSFLIPKNYRYVSNYQN